MIYGYARVSTKEQNEDRQIFALTDRGVFCRFILGNEKDQCINNLH